jgi:hypothetical protein
MAASSGSLATNPLQIALQDFQESLSSLQRTELLVHCREKLDSTTILVFTAEIDKVNASRRSRCVSSRLFGVLQSIQEFSSVVDTFASSYPELAIRLWGSLKITIIVCPSLFVPLGVIKHGTTHTHYWRVHTTPLVCSVSTSTFGQSEVYSTLRLPACNIYSENFINLGQQ